MIANTLIEIVQTLLGRSVDIADIQLYIVIYSCGGDQGVRSADTGGEVTSLWNWFWQIWLTKSTEYLFE